LKNPPVVEEIQVRYQDLDPYGHVNNALHAVYFESLRMAYWKRLAEDLDLGPLEAGDIPGARYVIAEATVRYKAPIFLDDTLLGAASIRTVPSPATCPARNSASSSSGTTPRVA